MLILSWLACGTPEPAFKSEPAPPSLDLAGRPDLEPRWQPLQGFLPPQPGMPASLGALDVGTPAAQAVAILDGLALRNTGVSEETAQGREVRIATLDAFPQISVVILLATDGATVEELQLTLPSSEGEAALVQTWGMPENVTLGEDLDTSYVWEGPGRLYTWQTAPNKGKGIFRIRAR